MLTESVLVALIGAALGVVFAVAGVKALVSILPADFPRAGDIHVDAPVFLFTLLIALGTGIVFGVVPAFEGSRANLRESLHESGRSATSSRGTLRLRNALVVSEVDPGMRAADWRGIDAAQLCKSAADESWISSRPGADGQHLRFPKPAIKTPGTVRTFHETASRSDARYPRSECRRRRFRPALDGMGRKWGGFQIQGEAPPPNEFFSARYHMASPGYFRALGIPLVRGRAYGQQDKADSRGVLIINEAMAKFWKHGAALGGKITFSDHPQEKDWLTIVGIVGDVKDTPKNAGAEAAFWWPLAQGPSFLAANSSIAIRSNLDPKLLAGRLRSVVGELDGNLAVSDVRTMEAVADGSYSMSRFSSFWWACSRRSLSPSPQSAPTE